ncbi:MAG: DsbA family protein [Dysgonomonas sp.]|nr:DsbA family protein [Dysgonomonas sp.]
MSIINKEHIQGPENASIELIEYGDYQCPYCKKAYQIVKRAQEELGDNLKFIFRNFPLTEIHPYAMHAAVAAEVAGSQGKFWEMHDMLFENQEFLDDSYLIQYAKIVKLDVITFEEDFGKDEYYQKIKKDYQSGIDRGVDGTPTFFVNGKKYEGNWASVEFIEDLKSLIK